MLDRRVSAVPGTWTQPTDWRPNSTTGWPTWSISDFATCLTGGKRPVEWGMLAKLERGKEEIYGIIYENSIYWPLNLFDQNSHLLVEVLGNKF